MKTPELNDDLAQQLAQDFLISATSGESENVVTRDADPDPADMTISTLGQEVAEGTDASNPIDAEPAEVPTAGPWAPYQKPD